MQCRWSRGRGALTAGLSAGESTDCRRARGRTTTDTKKEAGGAGLSGSDGRTICAETERRRPLRAGLLAIFSLRGDEGARLQRVLKVQKYVADVGAELIMKDTGEGRVTASLG